MGELEIRAVAVSAPLPKNGDLDSYLKLLEEIQIEEYAHNISRELGVPVRTRRLVLPFLEDISPRLGLSPRDLAEKVCEELCSRDGLDYIALPLRSASDLNWIVEMLSRFEKAFFSVTYSQRDELAIARLVREVAVKVGPVAAAHLAVSFGDQPLTPYFPATAGHRPATMVSLLYPTYLKKRVAEGASIEVAIEDVAHSVVKAAETALEGTNLPREILVDYSLSPWMRDSVAALVETIKGETLTRPGTHSALLEINRCLLSVATRYRGTGYNEVMLPVAEDDRLKELVRSGELGLSLLVSYVSVCVAGLDMVLLPSNVGERFLTSLMRDLEAIRQVKGRPLGMRVILTEAEPGEDVDLGFFGKTPVVDPYR